MTRRPPGATLLAISLLRASIVAAHAASDPAAMQIEAFDRSLLESMRAGATLNASDRYRMLTPAIERSFDLPVMTAFAVGTAWSSFTPAQQQATIAAFTRLTVSSYAHNFRQFAGESFEVDPNIGERGPDKIVQSHLLLPHDAPVSLVYRMRESAGSWKIIDVYYGAISQLTTRRSDFAASLAAGDATTLITHLNALSDDLMK
jgi:phospholipid transport system substrate-binding protein